MKTQNYLLFSILMILVLLLFFLNPFNSSKPDSNSSSNLQNKTELITPSPLDCVTNITKHKVEGSSLRGIVGNGEYIEILHNYYACNDIKHNDLVAIDYAGSPIPLAKIVKGIPSDNFNLTPSGRYWNLIINDEIAKNSRNQSYAFNEARYKMLNLYVRDYNHIIPSNTYLVLGNDIRGSTDSSLFGLIHKNNILGKVSLNLTN
jgi:signal peptidase I